MTYKNTFWVEKYRPTTVEEYIFQNTDQKEKIKGFITAKDIPHMLFTGSPGTGKSSLAFLLIQEMDLDPSDVLIINASVESGIDTVRDKIMGFASSAPIGDYKIILLDEFDYLSQNAQAALRRPMEEYCEHVRFIITANYLHKVLPAIISRSTIKWTMVAPNIVDVTERIADILVNERIKFDIALLDNYVTIGYPDIRTCISLVQQNITNGRLIPPANTTTAKDYKFLLLKLMEEGNWVAARELVCANTITEEYTDVYRFLYDNIHQVKKLTTDASLMDEAILTIADQLDKHNRSADPEITMAATMILLGQLTKGR